MSANPFIAPFDSLLNTLPMLPLLGAIVMPGVELPLNIFERCNLNLVNNAIVSHRMVGMIQRDPNGEDTFYASRFGVQGKAILMRDELNRSDSIYRLPNYSHEDEDIGGPSHFLGTNTVTIDCGDIGDGVAIVTNSFVSCQNVTNLVVQAIL